MDALLHLFLNIPAVYLSDFLFLFLAHVRVLTFQN
jgi:hypothetical protein